MQFPIGKAVLRICRLLKAAFVYDPFTRNKDGIFITFMKLMTIVISLFYPVKKKKTEQNNSSYG